MRLFVFLFVILACSIASAEQGITPENYDKIVNGASLPYVYGLLGKETGDSGSSDKRKKNLVWQEGKKTIRVKFTDGKVVSKTQTGLK